MKMKLHAPYNNSNIAWMLCCCIYVLLCACIVEAWSGHDAHQIVLLSPTTSPEDVLNAFYNGSPGTLLHLSSRDVVLPGARMHQRVPADIWRDDRAPPIPPYRVKLSEEWALLERPNPIVHGGDDDDDVGEEHLAPTLLHCRLPLPQDRPRVDAARTNYIRRHEAKMSAMIEDWWLSGKLTSGCYFGDGDGQRRMYEVCPREGIARIHGPFLAQQLALHDDVMMKKPTSSRNTNKKKKKVAHTRRIKPVLNESFPPLSADLAAPVDEYLRSVYRSTSARRGAHASPRYGGAFHVVGRYDAVRSSPRWNDEMRVWEMMYPSNELCGRREDGGRWSSSVRLRCAATGSSSWSVVEVRQLCRLDVEISADVVCGWEENVDAFHVNPIPCVEV